MKGLKFDKNGNLVPVDVYIVWGSPASGKTTYVKKHMEDGDLVVDLDLIKQSISMKEKTTAGDDLLNVALSVREHLYDLISERDIGCKNVWVVAGLPQKEERDKLSGRIKATEFIYIEATQKECIDRAMNDSERKNKEMQKNIIEKWFKQFHYE